MMPRSCLVLLALWPAAAPAEDRCPVAEDLAQGIVLTYAHGGSDTFTSIPGMPGAVRWSGMFEGMALGTSILGQGFILLSSIGPDGAWGETRYDYGLPPAALPRPEPGAAWEGVAEVTAPEGTSTIRQIHSYGAPGEITIGACTYATIPVHIAWPDATESLVYATDLGISWRAGDEVVAIAALRQGQSRSSAFMRSAPTF